MKKTLFALLLCVCLLFGCSNAVPDHTQPSSTDADNSTTALKQPDEKEEESKNQSANWGIGMYVKIEDTELVATASQVGNDVFSDPGDVFRVSFSAHNNLKKAQRYELMVFADGVPIVFTVDGINYRMYPIDLGPEHIQLELQFDKNFPLNLGRLDFLLSFAEKPQMDFHQSDYTIWIDLEEEPLSPKSLCATVEQRIGLKEKYEGDLCDAWIWGEGVSPAAIDHMGPRTISIQDGETILLEAIAGLPGLYRTVLVVNGNPVDFEVIGKQVSYLDWEATGTNMLQMPIKLADVPPSGSIYTVITPLNTDTLGRSTHASGRIELTEKGEE